MGVVLNVCPNVLANISTTLTPSSTDHGIAYTRIQRTSSHKILASYWSQEGGGEKVYTLGFYFHFRFSIKKQTNRQTLDNECQAFANHQLAIHSFPERVGML